MSLTVRRAQAFVKLNAMQDSDDYDIMDGHRRIGRLYRTGSEPHSWCWNISTAIAPRGLSGRAATRVIALQTLADTYQAVSALNGGDGERRSVLSSVGRGRGMLASADPKIT